MVVGDKWLRFSLKFFITFVTVWLSDNRCQELIHSDILSWTGNYTDGENMWMKSTHTCWPRTKEVWNLREFLQFVDYIRFHFEFSSNSNWWLETFYLYQMADTIFHQRLQLKAWHPLVVTLVCCCLTAIMQQLWLLCSAQGLPWCASVFCSCFVIYCIMNAWNSFQEKFEENHIKIQSGELYRDPSWLSCLSMQVWEKKQEQAKSYWEMLPQHTVFFCTRNSNLGLKNPLQ